MKNLIDKYNIPAPRYTSYPTVPYWDEISPTPEQWGKLVKDTFQQTNDAYGISLYIHLPFCESLCTYCGCNTRITINHGVEVPYIKAVLKEWNLYLALFVEKPKIKEIHLGGGTPTFFSPDNLKLLINGIRSKAMICKGAEFSFEAHPNNTTGEHLQTLYDLGFRRLSLGIQDFDTKVQDIINRVQTYEQVYEITSQARNIGYTSINYDLIYGLPLQTETSVIETIRKVITLHPDRIAYYSYAHVPWIKPGQRKFTEAHLPSGKVKRNLYELGRNLLVENGFIETGMDHFSLPDDELCLAANNKTLHRNFMGYTTSNTKLLIGLGVSSISDTWNGFGQNPKKVEDYYDAIDLGVFPIVKGHQLTTEDLIIRQHILNIMCNQETSWEMPSEQYDALYAALNRLTEMEKDDLITLSPFHLKVKEAGKPFLRNVCMAFDARLWEKEPQNQLFSSTI